MKIYKWYNGEIQSGEVLKETAEYYFLENRVAAFDHGLRIKKAEAHITEREAAEAALKNSMFLADRLTHRLAEMKKDISKLTAWIKKGKPAGTETPL